MKLSDIMASMHLSFYAEVALVLFLAAFAVIVFQVFRPKSAASWEAARQLPLEDVPRPPTDESAVPSQPHQAHD